MGKLFHIDLNDQVSGRYDQDFRFGSVNLKQSFFLVKFLEDVGYSGPRHFDAHAYRTEDYEGVKDFARGCMRTYLMLKEKASRWNADKDIQALIAESHRAAQPAPALNAYSSTHRDQLLNAALDRKVLAGRGLAYERLDQLTVDLLLGTR
jgi:xylose isomerase